MIVSECCGEPMQGEMIDACPCCKEHCDTEETEKDEAVEYEWEYVSCNWVQVPKYKEEK